MKKNISSSSRITQSAKRERVAKSPSSTSRVIFVLGGASSGKSELALKLSGKHTPRAFVATCEPLDEEMAQRIRAHRRSRQGKWETAEVPLDLADWFRVHGRRYKAVVVDCLTLWLCNLQEQGMKDRAILKLVKNMLASVRMVPGRVVMVSNEIGLGLVPENSMGRRFRSLAGKMNQQVALASDEVYFAIGGIPLQLK